MVLDGDDEDSETDDTSGFGLLMPVLSSSQIVTDAVTVTGDFGKFKSCVPSFSLVVHFETARGETGVNAAVVTVFGGSLREAIFVLRR